MLMATRPFRMEKMQNFPKGVTHIISASLKSYSNMQNINWMSAQFLTVAQSNIDWLNILRP